MKSFANWMIVIFLITFWLFRVAVAYFAAKELEFMVAPISLEIEIVMLFVTFICIACMVKQFKIGGFVYFATSLLYYGLDIYNDFTGIISGTSFQDMNRAAQVFASIVGMCLAIAALIDVLSYDIKGTESKNTEWFYKGNIERQKDDRDDNNQYRIL